MKKSNKIVLSILVFVLIVGAFAVTCFFTYKNHWNVVGFWWGWVGATWLIDIFVGCYVFYKKNRTDETKMFWLLVMIVLPIAGAFFALIYNFKLKTEYGKPDNDHTKLQSAIFKAEKSIKIYSNSLFLSNDTYNALNFVTWKGINIQIIVSMQKSKSKQEFLVYKLQKSLEDRIEFFITNKEIESSFIIIDDEWVITTPKNFNFKSIYSEKNLATDSNINKYISTWKNDLDRCSVCSLVKTKISAWKTIKFKLINIFYPFF